MSASTSLHAVDGTRTLLSAVLALSVLVAACSQPTELGTDTSAGDAVKGGGVYEASCAACHGIDGFGTELGPPLVHELYRPAHHGDASFFAAVRAGTRQHHWNHGNMPPQPSLSDQDIADVTTYMRALQRQAGID